MHLAGLFALGLCATAAASPLQARDELQELQDQAVAALKDAGHGTERKSCSVFNAAVRKDWAFMSAKERKEYTSAVNCLMKLPPKTDPALAPGVRNRYDDFVAQHINQTRSIHGTGNFLSWHRYFVHAYETALRDECSYQGFQPYWNWVAHTDDPRKSPVFDGSETSMSGDGAYVALNGSRAGTGLIFIPPGTGGGCVTSGPFKDMTVNLGPVSPTQEGETKVSTPLGYNPRCLKRDLSAYAASNWLTVPNLVNVTLGPAARDIAGFQNELQGRFTDGFLGLHAAGHFVMGGDAGDLYSSPVDPNFYLHHAMVDRAWWLWQALHGDQAETVAGTITINNNPPSRNTSLDDPLDLGSFNAPVRPIRDLLNTLSGDPLCYIYL